MWAALGFGEDFYSKTITITNPDTNTDEQWTLFAVQIRGSGYAGEWVSNFHIDPYEIDGVDYSEGFGKPAQEIYNKLKTEIDHIPLSEGSQTKNVKIWISGFSRGAAVSNALAGELTRHATDLKLSTDADDNADNIYAYTFATPNAVLIDVPGNVKTDYDNIHNTLNPCDIVPVVPMSVTWYGWNYSRYGTTHYFNYGEFTEPEREKITEEYKKLTGDTYNPYTPKSDTAFLPVLFELCFSQTVEPDEYIEDFYPYVGEMISLVFCGSHNDPKRLLHLNNNLNLLHPGDEKLAAAKEKTKTYSEENEELDEKVLRFLISRAVEILWLFSDDSNNAVSNTASDSLDERQGPIAQFTDGTTTIGFYQHKTWDDSSRFLGKAAELADNLIAEISALKKSGYDIKNITAITWEHYPEVYMSVLFSGITELDRLFAEKNPVLDELHVIVYDTKGGTMPGGKYVEVLPISDNLFELEDPEDREGYEFSGWVDENGDSIDEVNISEPGYTRVTAMWSHKSPIDENHTAIINEGNIDTITLPDISGGYLIVNELPAPKLSDGSISVSAVNVEYEQELPENLLPAASDELSDSNLQDYDTSAVIYFSIPKETAEYLAELSSSYDIINHPELGVLKCSDDDGDWYNLTTVYDGFEESKYRYHAEANSLDLEKPFSFAVCVGKFIPKKRSSSSSSQGTSIWLIAAPTPEPTPTPTPAPTIEHPTVVPLPVTPTPQSPAPFAGIAAGLCAAAVLFGLRRR